MIDQEWYVVRQRKGRPKHADTCRECGTVISRKAAGNQVWTDHIFVPVSQTQATILRLEGREWRPRG